jgi:phage shock protein PspC (stress-responsive transcriptional regulator)
MVRRDAARDPVLMTTDTPRLTRSTNDQMIGGVAGGLGRHFGVDPVLFRAGFVVAALMSGAGAIAYLALLVLLPRDTDPEVAPITGAARPASA